VTQIRDSAAPKPLVSEFERLCGSAARNVAEGVYYASHDSLGYTPIRFFDYARKKSIALAPKEITGPVNSLAVSTDGRSLLYTRVGDAEFDLILVSF